MAQMRPECRQALSAALKNRRRDDTLEQALGREFRKAGLIYQDYLDTMDEVRTHSRKNKVDSWDSVKAVLEQDKKE